MTKEFKVGDRVRFEAYGSIDAGTITSKSTESVDSYWAKWDSTGMEQWSGAEYLTLISSAPIETPLIKEVASTNESLKQAVISAVIENNFKLASDILKLMV